MVPWQLLDEAPVPGGSEPLRFYRRGHEFSIRVAGYELMNSRRSGSEDALGQLSCERYTARPGARVLCGGLGMGFTVAAALRTLPQDAKVVVCELVPQVVRWNEGPLGEVAGWPLRDRRVKVLERDVGKVMREHEGRYDVILLDVDNGPEGLTRASNDKLYRAPGLRLAARALRSGGSVWLWSAGPRPGYSDTLRRAGFIVTEHIIRADRKRRGARHTLWEARARGMGAG